MTDTFNTRIAPSPTGDMHLGVARTAYFNWLTARSTNGKFALRIDDTDEARSKPEYVQVIIDTMDWLKLNYDYVVYQSQRFDLYYQKSIELLNKGFAKIINDTTILNIPPDLDLQSSWHDEVAGDIDITDNDIQNAQNTVLIRSNGTATYNWASVIDDIDYNINYIIRGTDHITNTSKQVILWNILGADLPKFAHVGLIGEKGRLLSKRDGACSMLYYRNTGYDPDAMLNFLARIGWGPNQDDKSTKMLPRERMLELFLTGGKMRGSIANLDMDKLESFDRKYKAQKGIWRTKDRLEQP